MMSRERKGKETGRRIAGLLAAKGWRTRDLIARAGLKQASVYQWLRGESEPRGVALRRIAQALEVSTDYLLGVDPPSQGLTDAQVASRESLRLCLRDLGIGAGHPDYLMYQEVAMSDGAPKSATGWHDLITKVLPKVTGHLRPVLRSSRGRRSSRILPLNVPRLHATRPKRKKS